MSGAITITAQILDADKVTAGINSIKDAAAQTTSDMKTSIEELRARLEAEGKSTADVARITREMRGELQVATDTAKSSAESYKAMEAASKAHAAEIRVSMLELKAHEAAEKAAKKASEEHAISIHSIGDALKEGKNWLVEFGTSILSGLTNPLMLALAAEQLAEHALEALKESLKEGIETLEQSENSALRLGAAFHGDTKAVEEMISVAAKVSQGDPFATQAQLQNAEATLRMHHLNKDAIEQLLPVLADMAAVENQDVSEAASSLGRAFDGSGKALKAYGIQVEDGATREEIFAAILAKAAQFHEVAAAKASMHGGVVADLTKAQHELQAQIAEALLPVIDLWDRGMTGVTNGLISAIKWSKELGVYIKTLGNELGTFFADVAKGTPEKFLDQDAEIWKKAHEELKSLATEAATYRAAKEAGEKGTKEGAHDTEDPEKKSKSAKAEENQIANDRKQLRKQLMEDLAKVGKEGADKDRSIEEQLHKDRLAMAHGANDLIEMENKRHWQRIQDIAKSGSKAAMEAEDKRITARAKTEGADYVRSHLYGPFTPQEETHLQEISADQSKKMNDEWTKIEKETAEYVKQKEDATKKEIEAQHQAAENLAKSAGEIGERMLSSYIKTGNAPSAGDVTRGVGEIAGGAIGLLGGPGGVVIGTEIGKMAGDLFGSLFDRHDADLAKQAADAQAKAAEEQTKAAEAAKASADAWQASIDHYKSMNDDRLKAAQAYDSFIGTSTAAGLQADQIHVAFENDLVKLNVMLGASGAQQITQADLLAHPDGANLLSGISSKGLYAGGMTDVSQANDLLFSTISELFTWLKQSSTTDQNRAIPGSSPQTPSYSQIVNFREMWAFVPGGSAFRSSGAGTSRAINTGSSI